jgi:lipopolysaccharide/colanic/teichoic acid biosynthesis glycosyltransferase
MKKNHIFFPLDIVFIVISFLSAVLFRPIFITRLSDLNFLPFFLFLFGWILLSALFGKYNYSVYKSLSIAARTILLSTITFTLLFWAINNFLVQPKASFFIFYPVIIIIFLLELILAVIAYSVIRSPVVDGLDLENTASLTHKESKRYSSSKKNNNSTIYADQFGGRISKEILKIIETEQGADVKKYIKDFSDQFDGTVKVVSTTTRFNILSLSLKNYGCIINFHRVNDIQYINKFFEAVNSKLNLGGIFIGTSETYSLRKQLIMKSFFTPLNIIVYSFDFILKRIFPKVPGLKKIYFFVTKGENRLLSRAETLGRLCSCGFEIVDEKQINNLLFIVARKTGEPLFPSSPTYGPIIGLNRIGKNGKIFKVYKFRTMHPYAEYLQQYVFEKSRLQDGGKFKDDFRVSTLGKFMRKIWLDEIPMLINVLKGEMKLVGVRPLSKHYFSLYTKELQQERVKTKPGLIPPFYMDMPETLPEIMDSEIKYLRYYQKRPFITDVRYFFGAWKNIIFKNARSQ